MDLLSEAERVSFSAVFMDIHDTFGRDIVIWKNDERVVVSSDASYNFAYDTVSDVELTPVSGIFKARIRWQDPTKEALGTIPDQIREKIKNNFCRLKVLPECWSFMRGYEIVEVDGRNCTLIGTSRPHGVVDNQFLSIYLVENN